MVPLAKFCNFGEKHIPNWNSLELEIETQDRCQMSRLELQSSNSSVLHLFVPNLSDTKAVSSKTLDSKNTEQNWVVKLQMLGHESI